MILAANRCRDRSPNIYVADGFSEIEGILNPRPGDVALAIGPEFFDAWRLTEQDIAVDGFDTIQSNSCEHVWQRSQNPVNVAMFGATPNTGEDQTEAFDRAVAAAPSGSTLFVPAGEFILDNFKINKDLSLHLASNAVLKMKSQATGPMLEWTVPATGAFYGLGTVDGNKDGQTQAVWYPVVKTLTTTRFMVDRITFRNCAYAALQDVTSTGTLEISQCQFLNGSEHGGVATVKTSMSLWLGVTDIRIHHCRFVQDDYPSVAGKAHGGILIAGNEAVGFYPRVSVCDNYFYRVGMDFLGNHIACIHIYEDCDGVIIARNTIIEPLYVPILIQNSYRVNCSDNYIEGMPGNGSAGGAAIWVNPTQRVQLEGPHGCLVAGNTIYNFAEKIGILAMASVPGEDASRLQVVNNDIEACQKGIEIRGVSGQCSFKEPILVSGNTVTSDGAGLVLQQIIGQVRVVNNDIRSTIGHGMQAIEDLTQSFINLDGNYIETAGAGVFGAVFRGIGRLYIQSGGFKHSGGGGTAYFIGADASANPVANLLLNSALIVVYGGTTGITTTEVTTWHGTVTLNVDPNGNVQAPVGTLFIRPNGGAGNIFYVKEGALNTNWVAK